jgi:CspA family cold shock protein
MRGTVKNFGNTNGFGFIIPEGEGNDIFVHYTQIEGEGYKTLSAGDQVEFDVKNTERGCQAQKVKKI